MFVRHYLELPLPPGRVDEALLASAPEWLAEIAGEAQRRGDGLLAEVGVGPLGPRLGRRVAVRLGRPAAFPSLTSLPMTWEPLGLDGLLPRLDADIEVGPFGVVGRTIDRVLLHRVAEATVKDFLDRVGAAIIGQAAASGSGRHHGPARRGSA